MCTPVVLENIWKHKPQENNCDAVPFVGYLRSCSLAASASNLNPISTFAFFDFIRRYGNETFSWNRLTLSWRRPLSHRNQSIDLLGKSVDWFLYGNRLRHERVNKLNVILTIITINPLHATGLFLSLRECQKTRGFLTFSGGIERDQWHVQLTFTSSMSTIETLEKSLKNF